MASPTPCCRSDEVEERWSDANFEECVKLWKFDSVQRDKLRQLQILVQDIHHHKNDPYEVARYLVEFLGNVKKAHVMFRKMVQWRVENNVDTFMERYGEPPEIMTYLPLYLLNDHDKDGDPIYVVRVGAFDAWGMYQNAGTDAILQYTQFLQELTTTRDFGVPPHHQWQRYMHEARTGKPRLTQFTMIVDMHGLSRRHLRPQLFGLLQHIARIAQDHYAGFGKRILMLRAPAIFQMAWNIAKHFFDPHIQQLIVFSTASNYLEVCEQYMDLKALPAVIHPNGGQGQPMPGYFERIRQEGGIVPTLKELQDSPNDYDDVGKPLPRKDTSDLSLYMLDDSDDSERVRTASVGTSCPSSVKALDTTTSVVVKTSTTILFKGHVDSNNRVIVR